MSIDELLTGPSRLYIVYLFIGKFVLGYVSMVNLLLSFYVESAYLLTSKVLLSYHRCPTLIRIAACLPYSALQATHQCHRCTSTRTAHRYHHDLLKQNPNWYLRKASYPYSILGPSNRCLRHRFSIFVVLDLSFQLSDPLHHHYLQHKCSVSAEPSTEYRSREREGIVCC